MRVVPPRTGAQHGGTNRHTGIVGHAGTDKSAHYSTSYRTQSTKGARVNAIRVVLLVGVALILAVVGVWTDAQGTELDVWKVWTAIIAACVLFWVAIVLLAWEVF